MYKPSGKESFMKKLVLTLVFSLLTLQGVLQSQTPIVQAIINQANIDSLIFFVEELSGEVQTNINGTPYTIVSRHKNQSSNDKAADYIQQKLESYGLTVYNQSFSSSGRNVYGVQTGTDFPNQKYIICAHYDDMPSGSTAPGADDNASGTAAVLEAARIISQYISEYTIIYALWDEEEQGLIGSDYYATLAAAAGDSILGVVNLDMIAWDSDNNNIADLHTGPVSTSRYLKDKMVEVNTLYNLGLNIDIKDPGSNYSDHASFWFNNFGAILLIEDGTDFNDFYHTTNDLVTHFNQPYYLKMSMASFGTLATLANVYEIVPVELASFSASVIQGRIMLEWTTASELNNNGFEIERSVDGNTFATIGFVEGEGTTTEPNFYSFEDLSPFTENFTIYYRLKQVDFDGNFSYSKTISVEFSMPGDFTLKQNYPNPFNPSTIVEYNIQEAGLVSLKVYDVLGKEVATLVNEEKAVGNHNVTFDAGNLPSGVYFYTIRAGNFISTKKMMLAK
jgi:hypothetical protein